MCIRDRGRTVARTWPLCAGPTATQTTWTTYSSSLAPERPRAPGSVSWPSAHQRAVPRCAGELSHRNRIGGVADLGDELLLRIEVVADHRLQRPDLVQQQQFALRAVAQVAHQLTHL